MPNSQDGPHEPLSSSTRRRSALAWMQLIRLPNLPTAFADVLAGYWIGTLDWSAVRPEQLVPAIIASGSLYSAGMVFNDLFDLEQDRRERPQRPLPSGRIPIGDAQGLAWLLLTSGITAAMLLGAAMTLVAVALAAAILGYDRVLKATEAGPAVMGLCRSLNLLLGVFAARAHFLDFSFLAFGDWESLKLPVLAALANGVYVAGLTTFARREAVGSTRNLLVIGTTLMAFGLAMQGWVLSSMPHATGLLWACFAIGLVILAAIVSRAILLPMPENIQRGVKSAIFGLVVIDALLVGGSHGAIPAMLVLSLLIPALLIGRHVYST